MKQEIIVRKALEAEVARLNERLAEAGLLAELTTQQPTP